MNPAESSRPDLVVISPVRNEVETIRCTLTSMLSQTLRPARWVIVDDGSSDGTREIIERAALEHEFISVLSLPDRGHRQPGPGVVHAFESGLFELGDLDWKFVGKLDGDVELPPDYYEILLREFEEHEDLGIVSGSCVTPLGASFRVERNAPFHTRGPCKVYRRWCLEEIGGLLPMLGWDGLDGYAARMRGWKTRTLFDLQVIHLRPTHSLDGGFRGAMRAGRGAYNMHYRIEYLLARATLSLGDPPLILGGLGLWAGFWLAWLRKEARELEPDLVEYIRAEQRQRLHRYVLGSRDRES